MTTRGQSDEDKEFREVGRKTRHSAPCAMHDAAVDIGRSDQEIPWLSCHVRFWPIPAG
jgi:hypothetical protein